jgi:hypothetical protein
MYGSGYPDQPEPGALNKDFPFTFWPIAWRNLRGYPSYLLSVDSFIEFAGGKIGPFSRPGNALVTCTINVPEDSAASEPATYHVLADKATIELIAPRFGRRCSSGLPRPLKCATLEYYRDIKIPLPEQVVQYYRASSAALAIEEYNNTALWEVGTPDIPVPGNYSKLECMKAVMRQELPLVTGRALESSLRSKADLASQPNMLLLIFVVFLFIFA